MGYATVWDAVKYTPQADGEDEIRVRSVLDDAADWVTWYAPPLPPYQLVLAVDIDATATGPLVVGPYVGIIDPLNRRTLEGSIRKFPPTGVLRIGTEDIRYKYLDWDYYTFNGLERGY